MDIIQALNTRYSTKEFDTEKKIPAEDVEKIKSLLQLSPNSTNVQPWHFILTGSEEGKKRIAKSTEGVYEFNTPKILEASHVVVFCSRLSADEDYLLHVLDKEDKDGRFAEKEFKDMMHGARSMFVNMHKYELKDLQHWMEKQVYINIGNLLLGAAALGLDALPMEGVSLPALDAEFDLHSKGFTAVAVVSLGYRRESDFNAKLPKSRLSQDEILTLI